MSDFTIPNTDAVRINITDRQIWFGVLARAKCQEILALLEETRALPDHTNLRGPELGMAMLRGRMGGSGAPFNFGEITMSRCSIRDVDGRVGHGYATGRDLMQVELIARLDAVLQDPVLKPIYYEAVVLPLLEAQSARRAAVEAKAMQTEVKFFTLATMRS